MAVGGNTFSAIHCLNAVEILCVSGPVCVDMLIIITRGKDFEHYARMSII